MIIGLVIILVVLVVYQCLVLQQIKNLLLEQRKLAETDARILGYVWAALHKKAKEPDYISCPGTKTDSTS